MRQVPVDAIQLDLGCSQADQIYIENFDDGKSEKYEKLAQLSLVGPTIAVS